MRRLSVWLIHKTTAVKCIPAIGRSDDDKVEFGGLFGSSPIIEA